MGEVESRAVCKEQEDAVLDGHTPFQEALPCFLSGPWLFSRGLKPTTLALP